MAQTFLDWITVDQVQAFLDTCSPERLPKFRAMGTDQLIRHFAVSAVREANWILDGWDQLSERFEEGMLNRIDEDLHWVSRYAPFVLNDHYEVQAFAPVPQLVRMLKEQCENHAPEGDLVNHLTLGSTYVDLPHGTLLLGPRWQVRAIFVTLAPGGMCSIMAIVSPRGRNRGFRRLTWAPRQIGLPDHFEEICDVAPLADALAADGTSVEKLQELVERFLALFLPYAADVEQDKGEPAELLPHRPVAAGGVGRRNRRERRAFSLFRVRRLRFSQARVRDVLEAGSQSGRRLERRHFVQGHWRDQPCGKGRAERRRIWIEGFWQGPEGAPSTLPIVKLAPPLVPDLGVDELEDEEVDR